MPVSSLEEPPALVTGVEDGVVLHVGQLALKLHARLLGVTKLLLRFGQFGLCDLKHALSCIKGLKVAETELIESDTITRSGELYRPVWDIPYANRSRAPGIMKKLCREVFKTAKVPLSPRGPQLVVED